MLTGNILSVDGTLHVKLNRTNGEVSSVFEMDVDGIQDGRKQIFPRRINLTPGGSLYLQPPIPIQTIVGWLTEGCWALVVGLLALYALRWFRAERAMAAGRCPQCDFDLRASVDRCPECGSTDGFAKPVLQKLRTQLQR